MDLEGLDILEIGSGDDAPLNDVLGDGDPSMPLEGENSITGLEALITNLSLSIIAVLPTVFLAIFLPKRLVSMIAAKKPISRKGMILGPGVYFLASIFLLVLFLNLANSATDALESQYTPSGDGLTSAATSGSYVNFAIKTLPIYAVGILLALLNFIILRFAGPQWTLRTALASSFYSVGTILIIGFIPTILLTYFDPAGSWPFGAPITGTVFLFSVMLIPLWHGYHFVRSITEVSRIKTIGLCAILAIGADRIFLFIAG